MGRFTINKNGYLEKAKIRHFEKNLYIPGKVKSVGYRCFFNVRSLEKVELADTIEELQVGAFDHCVNLKEVKLSSNLKFIGRYCFKDCVRLANIDLPSSLNFIDSVAFQNCTSLKEIKIPNLVNIVQYASFYGCENLEKVVLPEGLLSIDDRAFFACDKLENIKFPKSLTSIETSAFSGCKSLKEIIIPDNVIRIGSYCFSMCTGLKKANLPSELKEIRDFSFSNCFSLESINIPLRVESIGNESFYNCESLKEIKFPNSLKEIGVKAFYGCKSLEKVDLSSINEIKEQAFYNCYNLESLSFSSSIEVIGSSCFSHCTSLKSVTFNEGLKKINNGAFESTSIKEIEIPSSVELIDFNAFSQCDKLEKIKFDNMFAVMQNGIREFLYLNHNYYYNDETMELIVDSGRDEVNLKGYKKLNLKQFCENNKFSICDKASKYGELIVLLILLGEEKFNKYKFMDHIWEYFAKVLNKDNYKKIIDSLENNKEFSQLIKRISINDYESFDLFKLSYMLGAFSDNKASRQRACEFIYNSLENGKLDYKYIHSMFESLKFIDFNEEIADFIMNKDNFKKLLEIEMQENGFISRICNSFDEIREYGRSNRGEQRYRKVTIEMCNDYFSMSSFENVEENNKDIARELIRYTHVQDSFEEAKEIRKQYIKLRNDGELFDHILKEELYSEIDKVRESVCNEVGETLNNLNVVSNNKFSYEFLSKYDPVNFVLGKYCSCCAHIEGVGKSIMKASILHPDCQNLVIRDEKGKIIAKSTLYINREQGYGVFNNVEVNNNLTSSEKKEIYKKYKEAVKVFANRYNELNSDNPINKITVGMHLNDLSKEIISFNNKNANVLKGMDFSSFGSYNGDWQKEQYIIWEENNKKIK